MSNTFLAIRLNYRFIDDFHKVKKDERTLINAIVYFFRPIHRNLTIFDLK